MGRSFGVIEVGIVIGLLDVLFLGFVLVSFATFSAAIVW